MPSNVCTIVHSCVNEFHPLSAILVVDVFCKTFPSDVKDTEELQEQVGSRWRSHYHSCHYKHHDHHEDYDHHNYMPRTQVFSAAMLTQSIPMLKWT